MLGAAAALGTFADASYWLQDMKQARIPPNLLTYNCYMSSCALNRERSAAQKCLAEMKKSGVAPDMNTYSLLIVACSRSNDPDSARRWLREMLASIGSKREAYVGVVEAFACASKVDSAMECFQEMRRQGFEPGLTTYCKMLRGAASCSPARADVAEEILRAMLQAGVTLNWRAREEGARAVGKRRLLEIESEPVKTEQHPSCRFFGGADKNLACSGDECSTASGSVQASTEEGLTPALSYPAPPGLAAPLLPRPPGLSEGSM